MRRTDSFNQWLGSDTDLSFAEWMQQREVRTAPKRIQFRVLWPTLVALCALIWGVVVVLTQGRQPIEAIGSGFLLGTTGRIAYMRYRGRW